MLIVDLQDVTAINLVNPQHKGFVASVKPTNNFNVFSPWFYVQLVEQESVARLWLKL
jgi:hypothetical protein